jgi:hypothetical protein
MNTTKTGAAIALGAALVLALAGCDDAAGPAVYHAPQPQVILLPPALMPTQYSKPLYGPWKSGPVLPARPLQPGTAVAVRPAVTKVGK